MNEQIVLVWRRFSPDSIKNSESPFEELIEKLESEGFTVNHQIGDGESSLIFMLEK